MSDGTNPNLPDYGNLSSPNMAWFIIQGESGATHLAFCDHEWLEQFSQSQLENVQPAEIIAAARYVISGDLHFLSSFAHHINEHVHEALDKGEPWKMDEIPDPEPFQAGTRKRIWDAYHGNRVDAPGPSEEHKGQMWNDISDVIKGFNGPDGQ